MSFQALRAFRSCAWLPTGGIRFDSVVSLRSVTVLREVKNRNAPVGNQVKPPPFQGGVTSSRLVGSTTTSNTVHW